MDKGTKEVSTQERLGLRLLELHRLYPRMAFHAIHDDYMNRQLVDFKPSEVYKRIENKRGG